LRTVEAATGTVGLDTGVEDVWADEGDDCWAKELDTEDWRASKVELGPSCWLIRQEVGGTGEGLGLSVELGPDKTADDTGRGEWAGKALDWPGEAWAVSVTAGSKDPIGLDWRGEAWATTPWAGKEKAKSREEGPVYLLTIQLW